MITRRGDDSNLIIIRYNIAPDARTTARRRRHFRRRRRRRFRARRPAASVSAEF